MPNLPPDRGGLTALAAAAGGAGHAASSRYHEDWGKAQSVWTMGLKRMCATYPDVFGDQGADLVGSVTVRGLWFDLLAALTESADGQLRARLAALCSFPNKAIGEFTEVDFRSAGRALARLPVAPRDIALMGRIGPDHLDVDSALGSVVALIVACVQANDDESMRSSSRGSRTGSSYMGVDNSWHRSRLTAFVSEVRDGSPDGDCHVGPQDMDTIVANLGIDASPFKVGTEYAAENARKRRGMDASVKNPLARIGSRPKTVQQALEFSAATRQPRGERVVLDPMLDDWSALAANPGCLSALVLLIDDSRPATTKMQIVFEALAGFSQEPVVSLVAYPAQSDPAAYAAGDVTAAELSLSKLSFSFKYKQEHSAAAAAEAMLGSRPGERKL